MKPSGEPERPERSSSHRLSWLEQRRRMEASVLLEPALRRFHAYLFLMFRVLVFGLRWTGLLERGLRNARSPRLRRRDLTVTGLPPSFEGYRILHLSDLHLPVVPEATVRMLELWGDEALDLVVITGDVGHWLHPLPEHALALMKQLEMGIRPRDGFLVTLGNHDHSSTVEKLETLGMTVLLNETIRIHRGDGSMQVTGIDDVHFFRTPASMACLGAPVDGFALALVHSPEAADVAAAAGYDLYLTGHTHGGQIRLPGLPPLHTALKSHRALAHGPWTFRGMVGFTSAGVGSSRPPVRFFCPPEGVLHTLRRATPFQGDPS